MLRGFCTTAALLHIRSYRSRRNHDLSRGDALRYRLFDEPAARCRSARARDVAFLSEQPELLVHRCRRYPRLTSRWRVVNSRGIVGGWLIRHREARVRSPSVGVDYWIWALQLGYWYDVNRYQLLRDDPEDGSDNVQDAVFTGPLCAPTY